MSLQDNNISQYYAQEAAENFFVELKSAVAAKDDIRKVYKKYQYILMKYLDERTSTSKLNFAGPFAKMDYLLKESGAKWWLVKAANDVRVTLRKSRELSDEELSKRYLFDLRSLCQFIAFVDKVTIPTDLIDLFPVEQQPVKSEKKVVRECMRMIVRSWDDKYVYGQIDDYSEEGESRVDYTNIYPTFSSDWSYLRDLFYTGAQLNLVRPHINEGGTIQPELIIFEPDYLVNVTSVARCFTHYADSPLVSLIHKIEPKAESQAIMLGNFAGQLLDEELTNRDTIQANNASSYAQSVGKFFKNNALDMLTSNMTREQSQQFHTDARIQRAHIHKAIKETLPRAFSNYNYNEGIVEPSFFSEMLGLQGRMDYLQLDYRFMFEQKSGKGGFPYDHFITPRVAEEHNVQVQLYMLVFRYNYRSRVIKNDYELQSFLLYSKYEESLLRTSPMPEVVFNAIKIRNGIAWNEMMLTQPGGYDILDTLTPEVLNEKNVHDKLWNNYQYGSLSNLLGTVHSASPLEKAYFFRFMRFISNEHVMSKLGNKTKECSGFASTWHDSLDTKRLAGNIYDDLTLIYPDKQTEGEITYVDLKFPDDVDNDMSNFRIGDIVILYPYDREKEPDASKTMVMRCTIKDITKDNHIILRLRHPQSDNRTFIYETGRAWAIEHDFMESSYDGLYKGMFSFLSAPKSRRDLLLFQREPEFDNNVVLRGNYGDFNELSLRVKQAKDFFLIIGPPGTGKTSFGLLNTLKEQLLEPDSSVILMSYTNRAVDEICSKLKEANIDFIRIGGDLSASSEYKENLVSERLANVNKLTDVRQMLIGTRVYVGTTTSINSHLNIFQVKQFDLAIIDEASQILEPHLMGILSAQYNGKPAIRKFVMIGDHKQLPAVVQQTPEESKVDEPILQNICLYDCRFSLFERLLRKYGNDRRVVYMLKKQGRMHPDIAAFPNYTFYNGQLRIVPRPHQEVELPYHGWGGNGIDDLLLTRRIAFISSEQPVDSPSDKVNQVEAEMIAVTVFHIYQLEKQNFSPSETVGVIVPYRNQISAVRKEIDKYNVDILHDITIDTVERYQGSQRRYIVYGFTIQQYYQLNFLTSNVFVDVDGTVVDRKLNVAMTRAEEHLIMIGHAPLLENNHTFHKLLEFVASRFGYFEVSKDDYVNGKFHVPDYSPEGIDMSRKDLPLSEHFKTVFDSLVLKLIQKASGDDWERRPFGYDMSANLDAIAYGRANFSNELTVFGQGGMTTEKQVLVYCYYFMRQYYNSSLQIFTSYKSWIETMLGSVNNRLQFIDIGCGPATSGIAFGELFRNVMPSMLYAGIDTSVDMKNMAKQFLDGMFEMKLRYGLLSSFNELDNEFWMRCSQSPSMVVFNLSYFFPSVSARFAERLAMSILSVVESFPMNKYVVLIQQSKNDNGVNSYKVFRDVLAPHAEVIAEKNSTVAYSLIRLS